MIEQIQEEINERLAEAGDEIIKNRVKYAVEKSGFLKRFFALYCRLYKESEETADNPRQEVIDFLIDEMDVNG